MIIAIFAGDDESDDKALSADITQDVFFKLWERRTDFADQLKIRYFLLLLLILKNTLADEIGPKSLIIRRVVIKESVLLQKKHFFCKSVKTF